MENDNVNVAVNTGVNEKEVAKNIKLSLGAAVFCSLVLIAVVVEGIAFFLASALGKV